jgi:hypothetical protein
VDLTAYHQWAVEFDINVVSGDANITMKLDCFFPVPLAISLSARRV